MSARRTRRSAGSGSSRQGRSRDTGDDSRPLGGVIRPGSSGLGVAAKFSMAAAAVVAVSMLVFALIVNKSVSGILSQEIDEAGVAAAVALSATDLECWYPLHGTILEGREGEFEDGTARVLPGEGDKIKQRRAANLARAASIAEAAGSKLLDVVILDAAQTQVVNGRGAISIKSVTDSRSVTLAGRDDGAVVSIKEGTYQDQRGKTRARTYSAPILDDTGVVVGHAVVVLSEERIGSALSRLLRTILLLALMFTGVGLLVSWFVGQRITRPIALLRDDIDAVAEGDLDHRTLAHSNDEIGVVARTFDRMTQRVRSGQDLQKKQAAQEHEIMVARQVQESLLPEQLPDLDGYECAATTWSEGDISGNYYDGIPHENGDCLFVLGSASGGGVPAAMVMTMARSLIQAVASQGDSPAAALRRVNAHLSPDLRRGMYVTVLLARLSPTTGRLTLANAGHHPLILCRKGSAKAEVVHGDGIALGFDKGPIFDRTVKDVTVDLLPGDRILFCTRSVFEVKNAQGQEIGEQPLYEVFARESGKNSQVFVPMVTHFLEHHQGGGGHSADRAFLTVKRLS